MIPRYGKNYFRLGIHPNSILISQKKVRNRGCTNPRSGVEWVRGAV